METKKHFKLYKAGKRWCCLAIVVAATATGLALNTQDGQAAVDTVTNQLPNTQMVNAAVTPNSNNQYQQVASPIDNGDYGWLDNANVVNNHDLHVCGWQATNQAVNKPYRYVLAYDQTTNSELGRSQVTTNVNRPDVAAQYPQVRDAKQAGYDTIIQQLDWSKVKDINDNIQIISRYTNDAQGNGQTADSWSRPISLDKGNYAYLDNFTINNSQLIASGWNATNQSLGKKYHYLILFDQTANHELGRHLVNTKRPDVAKTYPQIINAQNAGFSTAFSLNNVDINHNLRVISRYSDAANGEGNHVDYWFNIKNFAPVNKSNQGWLDTFNLSNGQLNISGWHATDYSQVENNHYLILFDSTSKTQVASIKATMVTRPDVAKAYPGIKTAVKAGFNGNFGHINLIPGHHYSVVSRYSTSNQGNGGAGQYTDYWFNDYNLNQAHYNVDSLTAVKQGLHLTGWMTSDYAIGRPNAYIILLDNGHEVGRAKVNLVARPDVAAVYPNLYNSLNSGFSTDLNVNPANLSGNLKLIFRFAGSTDGNGDYSDQISPNYPTNAGSFDTINVTTNAINISGWHASTQANNKPYQYLIVLDSNGHELYRQQITNKNLRRSDVQRAYPWIEPSLNSGFQTSMGVPANMLHKVVRFIHRFTDDAQGNGHFVDYYSNPVSIFSGAQTVGRKTTTYDNNGNIVAVFNNAEVISQLPELPTGCEITAVTMMLRYAGLNVNKVQLANEMPRSNNGNYGFVGNPFSYSGWWIFPTGIAPVVRNHIGHADIMTGASMQQIKNKLIQGHLVVVWVANVNGFINHALALTGFNSNQLFYNNPWTGRKEAMTYASFYQHWNADAQRAISY